MGSRTLKRRAKEPKSNSYYQRKHTVAMMKTLVQTFAAHSLEAYRCKITIQGLRGIWELSRPRFINGPIKPTRNPMDVADIVQLAVWELYVGLSSRGVPMVSPGYLEERWSEVCPHDENQLALVYLTMPKIGDPPPVPTSIIQVKS